MGRMERRQQRKSARMTWRALFSSYLWLKMLAVCAALFIVVLLILNIFIWRIDVSKLEEAVPKPTVIYDQNGEAASKITGSKIEGVSIKQIPDEMIHAVISTEDQLFYKHSGINYFGIIRAFFQNITSGEIVAGGSTITQQLAKNVFLTHERTYTRKIKELFITKKIEWTYSKEEILERYINQIYLGEGAWGIQRAAQTYFGKETKELTLGEAAMIAGLIKAPNALSPFKDMNKAIERRNLVLSLMEKEGYITVKEREEAESQPVVLEGRKIDEYKGQYPYYVDHIIAEAIEKYDLTENEVLSGGLKIYTELNPVIQEAAEKVIAEGDMFSQSPTDQVIQAGAVFIDPVDGGIRALVGGRGEHTFRGFNRATQLKRQPGSTMKPLAVYTPALEQGYDVFERLKDSPLNINGYEPMNFDRRFRGEVTMYEALIRSYNVPPVWLLDKMGVDYGTNAVKRFGIPLTEADYTYALALGGMSEGVSPLQMAEAYSVFPNDGLRVEAHSIKRIENADGELIGKWHHNAVKVTDSEVAQKMNFMLRGVIDEGTGTKAQVDGWEIAGKTGTTQLPFALQDGAKDHWFVGYTPEIVGAIWMGYDNTDENHYMADTSGSTVTKVFQQVFSQSIMEFSQKEFDLSAVEKELDKQLAAEKKRQEEEEKKAAEEKKRQEEAKKKAEQKNWLEKWKTYKEDEKERKREEKEKGRDEKKKGKEDD